MPETLRMGDFELDLETGELRRGAETLPLRPQPTRILLLLARNAGRLVTRDELRQEVWEGSVVEFDQGINACIRQIRARLGDNASRPTYIETVPRRGYRLIAPVEPAPPPRDGRRRRSRRTMAALAAAVLGIAALLGAVWWLTRTPDVAPVARFAVAALPGDLQPPLQAYPDTLAARVAEALAGAGGDRLQVFGWEWAMRYDPERRLVLRGDEEIKIDYVVSVTADERAGIIVAHVSVERTDGGPPVWSRRYEARAGAADSLARRIPQDVVAQVRSSVLQTR